MFTSLVHKLGAGVALVGLLLLGALALTTTNSVTTHAQYGEYVRCENITNPGRRQACNARTQRIVNRRVQRFTDRAARRIQRIIAGNAVNKNALILSALNVAYWEIWNLYNVIFPLAFSIR